MPMTGQADIGPEESDQAEPCPLVFDVMAQLLLAIAEQRSAARGRVHMDKETGRKPQGAAAAELKNNQRIQAARGAAGEFSEPLKRGGALGNCRAGGYMVAT